MGPGALIEITGLAFTFNIGDSWKAQPVEDDIYVNVTKPGDSPETEPDEETVAISLLLLNHTPPVAGSTFVTEPSQIVEGPEYERDTEGSTVTT